MKSKPLPCPGPECGRPVVSHGLCAAHRRQAREGKTLHPLMTQGHRPVERCPSKEILALVAKTARGRLPVAQQAKALGMTGTHLQILRTAARKAGYDIPSGTGQGRTWESSRWAELDRRTARCECGLLLPCSSCTGSAKDYMRSGRPAGGDSMWSQGGE